MDRHRQHERRERYDESERHHARDRDRNRRRDDSYDRRDRRRRSRSRSARRSRSPRRRDDETRYRPIKRERSDHYQHTHKREDDKWGVKSNNSGREEQPKEPVEKEQPNFGTTGALLEDTNKVNGVVVKYAEPQDARKPKRRWRLYPFKGETALPVLHIHRQSCFLIGRDRAVVDMAVDHPSCSKQHAALQYRLVPYERPDGSMGRRVWPYLIDLDSSNGTFLNNKPIEPRKYHELHEQDVIKFAFSSREYVLLHENSKEDQEDDDVVVPDA